MKIKVTKELLVKIVDGAIPVIESGVYGMCTAIERSICNNYDKTPVCNGSYCHEECYKLAETIFVYLKKYKPKRTHTHGYWFRDSPYYRKKRIDILNKTKQDIIKDYGQNKKVSNK